MMKKVGFLLAWDLSAFCIFLALGKDGTDTAAGLIIGSLSIGLNYRLLSVVISNLVSAGKGTYKIISAMLLHMARLLIFALTIYICVKISVLCAVGYTVSVIGFALMLVITNIRGDENDKCR